MDNACNCCLFSIPTKVEMAEEKENLQFTCVFKSNHPHEKPGNISFISIQRYRGIRGQLTTFFALKERFLLTS